MKNPALVWIGLALLATLSCDQTPERAVVEPATSPMEKQFQADPDSLRAVNRAIAYHGGLDTWRERRSVQFDKTTIKYDAAGTEVSRRKEVHRYLLNPQPRMRIDRTEEAARIVLLNDGEKAWKFINGVEATDQNENNGARNATFGSHYVFNMPFKLLDPGVVLSSGGRSELDGIAVDLVNVEYPPGVGDAGGLHNWTYMLDAKSGRLAANIIEYEPGKFDYTEYIDDQQAGPFRLPMRRNGFHATRTGKEGPRQSEIVYENIRFDVPLDAALFDPLRVARENAATVP